MTEITIPYRVRPWFREFHASRKRWIVIVAHRRAGKTVSWANQLIRAAISNTRQFPAPQYAYVAPSFAQAKDLVWAYLQQYTSVIPGMRFLETELTAVFPTGARIKLFGGSAAYERIRGMYLDGAVLDEMALLHPDAFHVVIRPALADYGGFAIIGGTPAGRDHFWQMAEHAQKFPDTWDFFSIPVENTTAIHPDELEEIRRTMTANQYAREFQCSFEAPVEGSYYGDLLVDAQADGRICKVPYDPHAGVVTSWDIGMHDKTCIWFMQRCGREFHFIDYLENNNKPLEWYVDQINAKGYVYSGHVLPHDIKAREMGTGLSRKEVLENLNLEVTICPDHRVEDGINAVRGLLVQAWFDEVKCGPGLTAVKAYQTAPALSLGTVHNRPLKNWAGHASDSLRYMAMGRDRVLGWASSGRTWGEKFKNFRIPGMV